MKIIKIKSCWKCPYMRINPHDNFCGKTRSLIMSKDGIVPDWCPLEDAPESMTISRSEALRFAALRIATEILNKAEAERLAITELEGSQNI
jgi:hypothetical protein